MNKQIDATAKDTKTTTHPNVRISATDFGPIASGTIDLRPLTVFVGPSNTGKTYFAILIYAMHRILDGFRRFPVKYPYRYHFGELIQYERRLRTDFKLTKEEIQDGLDKLETKGKSLSFMDLPRGVRDAAQAILNNPDLLASFLHTELGRSFDLESVSDLVRLSGISDGMNVSLRVSQSNRPLWHFGMEISESQIIANGRIEDMVLFPDRQTATEFHRRFSPLREFLKDKTELGSESQHEYVIREFFSELLYLAASDDDPETYYLPAARSGIMQSHRVIASSLVGRSTRAGLERFPELPTFSGVMADFMQKLILYDERQEQQNLPIRNLAYALEREVLAGQIRIKRPTIGGYPEFVYQPQKTEANMRLTRASSMVSELAPVVLFLRSVVNRGDTLIIEEPEAHLHPAAQTQMAKTLGRLVRAGVRVVVTTHSDWLLKEIGNLVREGEMKEKTGEPDGEDLIPSSLLPSNVGVWQFCNNGTSTGSTVEEIPYDRIEGVEPEEYEYVSEALYNRSADLQNQLAETAGRSKYRHE